MLFKCVPDKNILSIYIHFLTFFNHSSAPQDLSNTKNRSFLHLLLAEYSSDKLESFDTHALYVLCLENYYR